jgi:hypothetical protein
MDRLSALLGGTYDKEAFKNPTTVPGTLVQIYAGDIRTDKGVAAVKMIVWSLLTLTDKQALCEDSKKSDQADRVCPGAYTYDHPRASLNNMLKSDLMNTCLADAILYSGVKAELMRGAMMRAVCHAAGGEMTVNGCEHRTNPALDRTPLALIAESLGSKMLTDALFRLRGTDEGKETVRRLFGQTRMIYLLANQIPMLDLALPADPSPNARSLQDDSLRGFVEAIRPEPPKGARLALDNLFVVAFSDPNDILSYRLRKDYFGGREDVRVVNVISSNAGTLFGLIEHPWDAHTGYIDNPRATKALICGNQEPAAACPAR